MRYEAEQRNVRRKGKAYLGWFFGEGQVHDTVTMTQKMWCVTDDGTVIAECRSKRIAEMIAGRMNP